VADLLEARGDGGTRVLDTLPGRRHDRLLRLSLGLCGLESIPLLGLRRDDLSELVLVLVQVLVVLLVVVGLFEILVVEVVVVEVLFLDLILIGLLVARVLPKVAAELILLRLVGAGLLVALVRSAVLLLRAHAAAIPGKALTKPSSACR
jgi:hypothetical protein